MAARPWLPDFCRWSRIAAVLGIAELVVIVIAIAPTHAPAWTGEEFATISGFALWLALTLAVVYCKSRVWIDALPRPVAIAVVLALPLILSVFGAWAAQEIDVVLRSGYVLPKSQRWRFVGGIAMLTTLISALSLRYFYVREQWQAQVKAHAKAEADALQARIRPHFLFNSMNTIASLVRRDPATAERAIEDLSELFRAALGVGQGDATLAEEIYLTERYLAIEALRLGDRLQVDWQIADDAPRQLRLPRLVLQPLLENAVLHGISLLPEGGRIVVTIARTFQRLQIRIDNPAPTPSARVAGHGHAQESIAQRLAYYFGTQATMATRFRDGRYECLIELPLT